MSVESVMPSNHLILCRPLLLPSIFPSTRVFSNESILHIRWPKYWSFSFSISLSNEYPGLILFKMDWFYLLAVLATLKSLLQVRVGWFERVALKRVYYHMWSRLLVQVRCVRQGAQGWCTGLTLRDGMGREVGGGFWMGNTCTPMADSCQCLAKTTIIL